MLLRKQRSADKEEFWMLRQRFWATQRLAAGDTVSDEKGTPLFPKAKKISIPRTSRWFVRRLRGARAKSLLELVTILDSVMNNTSVILLFEVGGKKLLFPGDAQIESWSYALARADVRAALAGVDVLKVGHHGSRYSTSEGFLRRVAPDLAMISAGRGNRFGLPSPDTLALLHRQGTRVFRSDEDGTIELVSDGTTWSVSTPYPRD